MVAVCDEVGNPNYGFSSFDSMPEGALLVFQVITLEGWTELMDVLLDVSMDGLVGVFFGVIVCVGAFFLTNYLLAQVCLVFTSKLKVAKALEEKEKKDLRKVASIIGQLNGGKGKKRNSQPMFTIEMVAARGLRRMDLVSSDPYAVAQCGADVKRTRTIRHTLVPEWNETVQFQIENPPDSEVLSVQVFDEDFASKDQAMGAIDLELKDYPQADEDVRSQAANTSVIALSFSEIDCL